MKLSTIPSLSLTRGATTSPRLSRPSPCSPIASAPPYVTIPEFPPATKITPPPSPRAVTAGLGSIVPAFLIPDGAENPMVHSSSFNVSKILKKAASFISGGYAVKSFEQTKPSPLDTFASLLKNYAIGSILACFAAGLCIMISYSVSSMQFRVLEPTPNMYFDLNSFTRVFMGFTILGLLFFAVFQYYVFNGKHRLLEGKYLFLVILTFATYIILPVFLDHLGFPYYYYMIDVVLILVFFSVLCFMVGFYGREEGMAPLNPISVGALLPIQVVQAFGKEGTSNDSTRKRVVSGFFFLTTEALVSVTALIYGMFFVTFYSSLTDINKMLWRLFIHPLYFEVFMMIPVRYLVARKMKNYTTPNILYTLAVVHAQSHISTLGRMMFSTLNNMSYAVLSIALLNIGKFFFRLSSPIRDSIIYRVLHLHARDSKFESTVQTERQNYIVSAGIQTEIIVENACAIFSGFTMWFFQNNKEIFMFPYPSDYLSIETVMLVAFIQISFALIFDLLTLYVAQVYLQLPILGTWKAMWNKRYRYFGFLLYGLFSMGLIGIFYMGFRVPRISFCYENNVCTCVWLHWMSTDCNAFIESAALS